MTAMPTWTLEEIPDLTGQRALVTGVTGGIGHHAALELARKGAQVVVTGRDESRLSHAADLIRRVVPTADLTPLVLDLADLTWVRSAADRVKALGPVHILVNNAGVMATPERRTADGFDLQLGTNHFGPFAFTAHLMPQLVAEGARVVTVSSQAHRMARRVPLTDPRVPNAHYRKWPAYAESKLANLLFTFELDRRARMAGLPLTAVAAHPGYASTNLVRGGLRMNGASPLNSMIEGATRLVAQSASAGARPVLMAATTPGLPGGTYLGPSGPGEWRGHPTIVGTSRAARSERLAADLWDLSEAATGSSFGLPR